MVNYHLIISLFQSTQFSNKGSALPRNPESGMNAKSYRDFPFALTAVRSRMLTKFCPSLVAKEAA